MCLSLTTNFSVEYVPTMAILNIFCLLRAQLGHFQNSLCEILVISSLGMVILLKLDRNLSSQELVSDVEASF